MPAAPYSKESSIHKIRRVFRTPLLWAVALTGPFAAACGPQDDASSFVQAITPLGISNLSASPAEFGPPAGRDATIVELGFDWSQGSAVPDALEVTTVNPDGSKEVWLWEGVRRFEIRGDKGRGRFPRLFTAASPLGKYSYTLRLRDAEGKFSAASSTTVNFSAGLPAALAVSGFSPSSAKPGGGISLDVQGLLPGETGVRLFVAGVPARVTDVSAGRVQAVVPAGAVSGAVAVRSRRGVAYSKTDLQVLLALEVASAARQVSVGAKVALRTLSSGLRDPRMKWAVDGVAGGSPASGRIDAEGNYRAPVVPPPGGSVTVSATSLEDPKLSAGLALAITPRAPLAVEGILSAAYGGSISDEHGLLELTLPAGALAKDTQLKGVAAALLPRDIEGTRPGMLPLTALAMSAVSLKSPADYRVQLPRRLAPGTVLRMLRNDGSNTAISTATVDASGLSARGKLLELGAMVLVAEYPPANRLQVPGGLPTGPLLVSEVAAPPDQTVEEGMTLPVRLRGQGFWPSYTAISVADLRLRTGSGAAAPIADAMKRQRLIQSLVIGPVVVSSSGSELGFTLRANPTADLLRGEQLQVSFLVERLSIGGQPLGSTTTDPARFVLSGLPELLVGATVQGCAPQRDLFSIDGDQIHATIDSSDIYPHRFSTLVVDESFTLGLGSPVASAPIGNSPAVDLSTVGKFEAQFGPLPWVDKKPAPSTLRATGRIFQPDRRAVNLEVTGPVRIYGTVYLNGMHGGENPALLSPPGAARPGGLFGARPSGGEGGGGGVTSGGVTQAGSGAGGPFPDNGLGHTPNGPLATAVVARGGAPFDPVVIEYDEFVEALINVGGALASVPTGAVEAVKQAASLVGKSIGLGVAYAELATPVCVNCGPTQSVFSGQGGHGGLRPASLNAQLNIDADLQPGAGGGGGSGGGSSSYEESLFGITLSSTKAVGGGGGGGGGGAGALRLTSGDTMRIYGNARLLAHGGRGGMGESHQATASPGGGGGGGAGGLMKLQGLRVVQEGQLDLSGGERGAALLARSRQTLPYEAQLHAFDRELSGGLIYFDRYESYATLAYATGRMRTHQTLPLASPIYGMGVAVPLGISAMRGVLLVLENKDLYWMGLPDYAQGQFSPLLFKYASLQSQFRSVVISDVVQSTRPPYNIYVSTVDGGAGPGRGLIESGGLCTSAIHELDAGGNYIRQVYSAITTGGVPGVTTAGHLGSIDLLSDGRLVALMSVRQPSGGFETGVHAIDVATGARTLLFSRGGSTRSMAVIRSASADQLVLTVSGRVPLCSDMEAGPAHMERVRIDGSETGIIALAQETIAGPGEPGLLRADGVLPGGLAPAMAFDAAELPNLRYQGTRATSAYPVLGGLDAPATGAGTFGSQVFLQSALTVYAQGSDPGTQNDVCREAVGAVPSCPRLPPASADGQSSVQVSLVPGFNTLYPRTTTGGAVSDLLKRRVLLIAP